MAFSSSQQRRRAGKDLRVSKLAFGKFRCQVTLCQELVIFWVDTRDHTLNYFEGFADAVSNYEVCVHMNHSNLRRVPRAKLCFISRCLSTAFLPKPPTDFPEAISQSSRWFHDEMGRAETQDF